MHEHLRDRLLRWWAELVCDRPITLLVIALLLAAVGVFLAATRLGFQPDRNALISADLDWNARYIEYRERFAHDGLTVVVAVPKRVNGMALAEAYVDDLGHRLQQAEHIRRAMWRVDIDRPTPAIRMLPADQFEPVVTAIEQMRPIFESPNVARLLAATPDMISDEAPRAELAARIGQFAEFVEAIEAALDGESAKQLVERMGRASAAPPFYLVSNDGAFLFVQVDPLKADDELEPVQPAVREVRRLIAELKYAHPAIDAGLTGVPVIEADETAITERDATRASVLAVVVIAVMLIVAFHSTPKPLMAVTALLVGIAWSFGYLTLAVGHLQLLSVVFTVILLGLGIDFGIHLISRFEMVRHEHPPGVPGFRETMIDTMRVMGPGIATGALTTAVAFSTTMFTDFQGMAEMGHIAGAGIVLCLIAMFTVLPALMRLLRPRRRHVVPMEKRNVHLYQHRWWAPFFTRPWRTIGGALVLTIIGGYFARDIRYDYNLSNLLPRNIESVIWFNRIAAGGEQGGTGGSSVWFGASVVADGDLDEVHRRVQRFRGLDVVAEVGGAGWLVPIDDDAKLARLAEAHAGFGPLSAIDAQLPDQPATRLDFITATIELSRKFGNATLADEDELRPEVDEQIVRVREVFTRVGDRLITDDMAQANARLAVLHEAFVQWRGDLHAATAHTLAGRRIQPHELPEVVRRIAVGREGQGLMIQVFPKGNVYDPNELEPFVERLSQVDPQVTGTAVQIYRSSALMVNSYVKAGLFALVAVFLLVLLDFQRLFDALLCLVPVGMAFVMLLGILAACGMSINPANIIVLPLLFGIGVDCGVHIMHRYRVAPDEHPPGLAAGTGKAIWLTSLTSIIGFSSLLIASHRGIASLGFTLSLGLALTVLICMTVMPSILELRGRKRSANGEAACSDDGDV